MTFEQISRSNEPSLWALLIGINEYQNPSMSSLQGCVNDVQALKTFLINQLNVPQEQIRVLINSEATRESILDTFQTFLIGNPAIKRGDQILFHYSGHGAKMRCPHGWNVRGYVESLVPYDGWMKDVYNIPDKTLGALLDRLAAAKGDHITVMLDSCHSGSGTRDITTPGAPCVRQVPADERVPPDDLDAEIQASIPSRLPGPSGWGTQGMPYVLLASCRDNEYSQEYSVFSDDQQQVWFGSLTYFTLQALNDCAKMHMRMSYSELHERVAVQVNKYNFFQMPQCEGEGSTRTVFGDLRIERDPFFSVEDVRDNDVILDGGLIHDLHVDTMLSLYPPTVRRRDSLPTEPLCHVIVTKVSVTWAHARIITPTNAAIPLHARGVITRYVYTSQPQVVALVARGSELEREAIGWLRGIIRPSEPSRAPSPYLTVQNDPMLGFDLLVVAEHGVLSIYGADDTLLVMPQPIANRGGVIGALESIARYRTLLGLMNQQLDSQLVGKVKLRLRHYVNTAAGQTAEDLADSGRGSELTLFYDALHRERNLYVVDVINESVLPFYAHVFILNPDLSIRRLYPNQGQQSQVPQAKDGQPGVLSIGLPGSGSSPLEIYLPDQPYWDSCHDYLKLIVTRNSTDLRMLEQPPLAVPPPERTVSGGSALNQLLRTVMSGRRFAEPMRVRDDEDWATAELSFTVLRASQSVAIHAADRSVRLSDQIVLDTPSGFTGTVTITTMSQVIRREIDQGPAPPDLDRFPWYFQPVGNASSRSIGPVGLALDFEVDEDARACVSPDTPLYLKLPAEGANDSIEVLPIAFDGEDYVFVGHSGDQPNTVTIVDLPLAASTSVNTTGTRGVTHATRLFLYKKIGRYTADLGLRAADLIGGNVTFRRVDPGRFQAGQSVALFIHGFASDTAWMVHDIAPFLRQEVLPYDHILTFDYESFSTTIKENAEQLASALKHQCGFGPNDSITLHLYAHSMGSVVARCMIELAGGHAFVDRLVMAGPPNNGTMLATSSRGLIYIATELLNSRGPVPPLAGTTWMLKQLYEQGQGLTDLTVDSDLLKQLNSLEPPSVPYLVLAGENVLDETEHHRLNRLAQKVLNTSLDTLFGEQNDTVVGVSSMEAVRRDGSSALRIVRLRCSHHNYYHVAEGREAIRRWISDTSNSSSL